MKPIPADYLDTIKSEFTDEFIDAIQGGIFNLLVRETQPKTEAALLIAMSTCFEFLFGQLKCDELVEVALEFFHDEIFRELGEIKTRH